MALVMMERRIASRYFGIKICIRLLIRNVKNMKSAQLASIGENWMWMSVLRVLLTMRRNLLSCNAFS